MEGCGKHFLFLPLPEVSHTQYMNSTEKKTTPFQETWTSSCWATNSYSYMKPYHWRCSLFFEQQALSSDHKYGTCTKLSRSQMHFFPLCILLSSKLTSFDDLYVPYSNIVQVCECLLSILPTKTSLPISLKVPGCLPGILVCSSYFYWFLWSV